jgi:predicted RNA-binding Zn ribbon-like protein
MPSSQQPNQRRWAGAIPYTVSPYLCLEFVNSRFANYTGTGEVYDRLEMADWRAWFLARAEIAVTRPATPETLGQLRQIRAAVRDLLERGTPPAPTTLAWINQWLAASPPAWQLRSNGTGIDLRMTWEADWPGVIGAILTSYGRLWEDGVIHRVRECANPHCTWLFYDESRNATRRWCDPQACGNLQNVHAHRERARAGRGPGAPAA